MENLLEKIKKYTMDGSPSVSELVELQEDARKLKISRSSLEKMISEAVASENNTDNSSITTENNEESTYGRLDFDSTRNSFDLAMNQRRDDESVRETNDIEFNRPEIEFPINNDPFKREEETKVEEEKLSEQEANITKINKETEEIENAQKELVRQIEKKAEEDKKKWAEELQQIKDTATQNHEKALAKEKEKFEQEKEQLLEESEDDTTFQSLKSILEDAKQTSFNDFDNSAQAEEVTEKYDQEQSYQQENSAAKIKQTPDPKVKTDQQRSFSRDIEIPANSLIVKNAKSAFSLGWVALIVSVVFGFIGAIIGIFGLVKSNEGIRKIKLSPASFASSSLSKLKNAKILSIIAIVIGVYKFLRYFLFGLFYL